MQLLSHKIKHRINKMAFNKKGRLNIDLEFKVVFLSSLFECLNRDKARENDSISNYEAYKKKCWNTSMGFNSITLYRTQYAEHLHENLLISPSEKEEFSDSHMPV